MDTILGGPEKPLPQQWWGYMRGDGTIVLKPYHGMAAVRAAEHMQGMKYVRGPFIADGPVAAMAKLRDKIQTAEVAAARKRLDAMKPERPIRDGDRQ